MKKDFETYIKNTAEVKGLPEKNRLRMRALLSEYAALQPRRDGVITAKSTPWSAVLFETFRRLSTRPAVIALILLVFLGTSGSLAYAAEGTIPGDALYPLKVDVTEPLRTALTIIPSAQADWQVTLATRRADEAATLASRGALSTSTQRDLAIRFTQNIAAAQAITEHEKEIASTSVATIIDQHDSVSAMRLAAYVKVFDTITHTHPAEQTVSFRDVVALGVQTLESDAPWTMRAMASTTRSTAKVSTHTTISPEVEHLRVTVQNALTQANEQIAQNAPNLTPSTSMRARAQLEQASDRAKEGEKFLSTGDRADATNAYQDSLGITAQLGVLLHAATHLNVDAFDTDTASSSSRNSSDPEHMAPSDTSPSKTKSSSSGSSAGSSTEDKGSPSPETPIATPPVLPGIGL